MYMGNHALHKQSTCISSELETIKLLTTCTCTCTCRPVCDFCQNAWLNFLLLLLYMFVQKLAPKLPLFLSQFLIHTCTCTYQCLYAACTCPCM